LIELIGKILDGCFVGLQSSNSMGIIYRQAKMLLDAHRAGVPMNRLLMIGHQNLFLHPAELRKIQKVCPHALANYKWAEYADRFFTECLGVSEVNALDYSAYEGANILHDLNRPIPDELKGQFDVVVEAGSLEHIFNFPIAIANLMQMTRVGGTIFASTVSNNLCGHGFYQFSPELIFRVFSVENGFELGRVLALEARYPGIELTPISHAFEVTDPASIGVRVGLMTKRPIMLVFEGHKKAESPLFSKSPMQSDYAAAWISANKSAGPKMSQWIGNMPMYCAFRSWLKGIPVLRSVHNRLIGQRQLGQFSLKNKRVFREIQ
jgi:hypothetical protein